MADNLKNYVTHLLEMAHIKIDGPDDGDIHIHNDDFYQRVVNAPALGLGESYMDAWWDCKRLDIFFDKLLRARLDEKIQESFLYKLKRLLPRFVNFQTLAKSPIVAEKHYDLGNELYTAMLDSNMMYSCGYYKTATNLDNAQIDKLDLICKKLKLKPGQSLLDIGCGFGGFAKFAAEKYGVSVVGVTLSKQQYHYANDICKGLPIQILLEDYREITGEFDRVVSIGMFEHVGHLNYLKFMQVVSNVLKEDGLFLLHTIGSNSTSYLANEWVDKYIFPNSVLPTVTQIAKTSQTLFVMEDWHNFGAYYDPTLMAWHENFNQHWPELKSQYDERFFRMWNYYLLSSAGSFRARSNQLWQIVFSKYGVVGGYESVR